VEADAGDDDETRVAESSLTGVWPVPDRAKPAPPISRAATGSPIHVAARMRDIVISTSSSHRQGLPAVAACTCGTVAWLQHGAK
jgi:hypothetical protein